MQPDIRKAAGIIIENRLLLTERSKGKDFFIAPGGSIEKGETPEQAVVRELEEEFQITVDETNLVFFGTFTAAAAGQEDKLVQMDVYTVREYSGVPTPDNEVEEIAWVDSTSKLPIGSIFLHEVIPRLKAQNLID